MFPQVSVILFGRGEGGEKLPTPSPPSPSQVSTDSTARQVGDPSFFLLFFGGHKFFVWGHWYPCFGFLVMSALGFKARVDPLLSTLLLRATMRVPKRVEVYLRIV